MLTIFIIWFFQPEVFAKNLVLKMNAPFPEKSLEGKFWQEKSLQMKKNNIEIEWLWLQPEKVALESLAKGKTDGVILSGPILTALSPTIRGNEKPYAYSEKTDSDLFLQNNKKAIAKELLQYDLVDWIQFYMEPIFIYSRKDFGKKINFENLKIWVWPSDVIFKDWIVAQKAKPVSFPLRDVLTKLKSGEIDMVYGIDSAIKRLEWNSKASFKSDRPVAHAYGHWLLREKKYLQLPPAARELKFN